MSPSFKEWYDTELKEEVTSVLCELPFDQSTIERWLEEAWEAGRDKGWDEAIQPEWLYE